MGFKHFLNEYCPNYQGLQDTLVKNVFVKNIK